MKIKAVSKGDLALTIPKEREPSLQSSLSPLERGVEREVGAYG